jgi:tRNA threonylcarbamoyladenosine biosynthesis protein TsaE
MSDHAVDMALLPAPEDTEAFAEVFAARLDPGDVVALEGDLGAGKTCFVRGLARGLGTDPADVSSPTFVSMQRYGGGRVPLVHVDAWRMHSAEDLETIGWDELVAARDSVIAVEWPSKVLAALPARRIDVTLAPSASGGRVVMVDDRRHAAPVAACRTCGAAVRTNDPFCSDRCRAVDLRRWLTGAYRIAGGSSEDGDADELTA